MSGAIVTGGRSQAIFRGDLLRRFGGREWHVPTVAAFDAFRGKDVLEVGCGIATDGLEFAKKWRPLHGSRSDTALHRDCRGAVSSLRPVGPFQSRKCRGTHPVSRRRRSIMCYSFGVIHHSAVAGKDREGNSSGSQTWWNLHGHALQPNVDQLLRRDHVPAKAVQIVLLPSWMPRMIGDVTGFDRWKLEGAPGAAEIEGKSVARGMGQHEHGRSLLPAGPRV